jgi:8-oxo-dGTP diphosphatase
MPMSPYLRELREKAGPMRLLLPSVSAHVFDAKRRLLLVQQRDSGLWSTPGGMIEPGETPADAVVREVWEETGLRVTAEQVAAVYGGAGFDVRYPNGDEVQYVIVAFRCAVAGGSPRADMDETLEARFWSEREAGELPLAGWLRPVLAEVFSRRGVTVFHPPRWTPPGAE